MNVAEQKEEIGLRLSPAYKVLRDECRVSRVFRIICSRCRIIVIIIVLLEDPT